MNHEKTDLARVFCMGNARMGNAPHGKCLYGKCCLIRQAEKWMTRFLIDFPKLNASVANNHRIAFPAYG